MLNWIRNLFSQVKAKIGIVTVVEVSAVVLITVIAVVALPTWIAYTALTLMISATMLNTFNVIPISNMYASH